MKTYGYQELREMVVEQIGSQIERAGLNGQTLDDDIDLLKSGLIDSFEFLDLMAAIEEQSGIKLDLGALDDSDFTTLRGLVANVLGSAAS